MPKVTVNDINLYYEAHGEGEPLVFIHGFAVDHLVFAGMLEQYRNNYQVFLIDNRGSGQSDCPNKPYTIEMMVADVVAFCRVLELGRCHFVGHSMGGMILQQLAYQHPELVLSATLCCTDFQIDIRYALTANARLTFMTANAPLRAQIESGLGWVFSSEFLQQPGMIDKLVSMRMASLFPITEIGYRNQLNALLKFNSTTWAQKIKVPCLVISGAQDIIVHESNMRKLAALIPNAHYECIPDVGHVPFLEKPALFHAALKRFLSKSNT